MESTGPEDSKNVKTSQAYFFEGFISFFEDFSLTKSETVVKPYQKAGNNMLRTPDHVNHLLAWLL